MLQRHVSSIAVDGQYLIAGLLLTLTLQYLVVWTHRRPGSAPRWLGFSCASLTFTLLCNVWLFKAPATQINTALLIRAAAIMAALVVLVPTTAALAGQRWSRWGVGILSAFCTARLVLLSSTNLIYAHKIGPTGAPLFGPWFGALTVPAYVLVVSLLAVHAARWHDAVARSIFVIGLTVGLGVLAAAIANNGSVIGELLAGYWIVPLVASLQVISIRQMTVAAAAQARFVQDQAAYAANLARTERRIRLALLSGAMGWFEYNPATHELAKSPELDDLLGLDSSDDPTLVDTALGFLSIDERDRVQADMDTGGLRNNVATEFRWVRPDGVTAWMETSALRVEDEDGGVEVLGIVKDITARKSSEAELLYQACHDGLTGLPNRAALTGHLREVLHRGQPSSLILIDLDGFKDVNDTLGHSVGDEVLVAVSRCLVSCLGDDDQLARLGGDEFAVALGNREADPEMVVTRMLGVLEAPIEIDGIAISVRASFGIAYAPEDGADADTLLRHADSAMYEAKKRGCRLHRYESTDDEGAARRVILAGQIPAALRSLEIEVYYQPTIELTDDRCEMLEALVRWHHPTDGLIYPAEFIPLAEQYGVGIPLARRVLADALAQCAHWRAEQLATSVAVNVSPRTLIDPSFLDCVAGGLVRCGVPGEALVLELTENAFADQMPAVLDALRHLGAIGVKIAIDDFGTGYSSLGYLKRLPVHSIKLDRSFTAGIGHDDVDNAIVKLATDLGHQLGLKVIAEGIESAEGLEALRSLGCDSAQGYWICEPGRAGDITNWLASRVAHHANVSRKIS